MNKKLRPLFNRMGSKYSMTDEILPLIPPHTMYVEPFVGGGSIFWNKVPAEKSVINDLNKEIIDGYKGFQKASLSSLQKLDFFDTELPRKDYKNDMYRNMIHKLEADMEAIKSQPVKHFIKTFKRSKGTFYGKSIGTLFFNCPISGYIPKLELYKKIIKDTVIEMKNYVDIIKKYDGPETFFFLDPPYEDSKGLYVQDTINYEQMRDILRNIKGTFLMTLNDSTRVRDIFKDFHITKSNVKSGEERGGALWKGGRNEVYISNYV
jgi:DNA adenine methylase